MPASSTPGPAPTAQVHLSVSPIRAVYDTPFAATVSGLTPRATVTLALSSTAKDGTVWSSEAQFQADANGGFNTGQAPKSGSYRDADPMGLTQTLTPGHPDANFIGPDPWTMTESVDVDGKTVASTTITRLLPDQTGLKKTELRPSAVGIYGEMYEPATTPEHLAPAVLVFGGSEGGLGNSGITAGLLASHGVPSIAVAYFHVPGLPQDLEKIPLEYFQRAARLLASQPGVDPHRIVLYGDSRGSEAALLTAASYPTVVHAVIAAVPSAEAVPGLPDNSVAAWTRDGAPVPTAPLSEFDNQSATSPAAIPAEKISGPILLICGGQDQVWRSCANSAAINTRLASHGRPPATLLGYPDAGHFVGFPLPYLPSTTTTGLTANGQLSQAGGTYQADQAARANAWPKILAFLASQAN